VKKELLIFGSSGALGSGVTNVFLNKSYDKIYLFDFKHHEISRKNVKQIIIKDLSNEENVKNAFNEITASKGTAYFLFSTMGGFFGGKKIWETDSSYLDRMLDMNLKTNFLVAKHFADLVKNSHSGSICLTAAYTGLTPESGKAVYGASKASLIHFVETLAEEGKEIRLSANAIAPYIIDTPANREWMQNANYEGWIKPEEIGEFVHSIFSGYNIVSGNIFPLKYRFDKEKNQ
jgi:NAD(P)-dependent dehydrogenase (short-subunit alcohol dehydrogenase family)